MTETAHDHARPGTLSTPVTRDLDVAPGRASRSASMDAPTHPVLSGLIARKAERDANGVATGADQAIATASSSSGMSLPSPIMRKFEASLGTDLSSVRLHSGAESASAASAVGAKAYTMGQDIHFGAGQYDPSSGAGEHLLAHEVAHTVQQRGGSPTRQNKLEVSSPQDGAEYEADRAADAMVSGGVASISGFAPSVARIATAYSDDKDLTELPAPPKYVGADGSFAAMAASLTNSMQGNGGSLARPDSGFAGSISNLIECRRNAESSQVYYTTHTSSKWNPFGSSVETAALAATATGDARWAIDMLGNARVAGTATATWISLANESNSAWADLVKRAKAMSIEVYQPQVPNGLASLADGQQHTKPGDQKINVGEVGAAGMELGSMARQMGIKAPDTTAYKTAMTDYMLARNEITQEQNAIITQLIPTGIKEIKERQEKATEEKDNGDTLKSATETFEKGLTLAFAGADFIEGGVGKTSIIDPEEPLPPGVPGPKGFDTKGAAEKGSSVLGAVVDLRIKALQTQIDAYNTNLGNYVDDATAKQLKAAAQALQNGLVKLRTLALRVETEQAKMQQRFAEFGKSIDDAMIKQGKAPKGSDDASQAAALFSAVTTAEVSTKGALTALSTDGTGNLSKLYDELKTKAAAKGNEQAGRADPRAAVFAIEGGRWMTASTAIDGARDMLERRNSQILELESQFTQQFAGAAQGKDSLQ